MSDTTAAPADPTLDRLFRHMAWANRRVIETILGLPDEALRDVAPGSADDWSVAVIVTHLVAASGGYAARLEGQGRPAALTGPLTMAELAPLLDRVAESDARLRAQAALPDGIVEQTYEGRTIRRARSTVLAQSIHHATEHRAQIAAALAANGRNVIDLDDLDLWAFGDAEGFGE